MKAVVIERYGGPEVLEVREVDRPRPGVGQILVRVSAAGVNPVDWKIRQGSLRWVLWLAWPHLLGGEVAGIVQEIGSTATRWQVGHAVFGLVNLRRGGGYAEYAVLDERAVAPKPDAWSFEEASGAALAGATALQALRDHGRLEAGMHVLINGASGGVGVFAVQIARALGAQVTAVCSSGNHQLVRNLGAETVLDYTREDFVAGAVRYDLIFDAAATRSFGECRRVLTRRGVYVTTLPQPGAFCWAAASRLLTVSGYGKRAEVVFLKARAKDLEFLARLGEQGRLRVVVDRVYSLEKAAEAHRRSQTGHAAGKIVLRPGPTAAAPP